jgi:alkylated DNA repair protein alkB family protein 7
MFRSLTLTCRRKLCGVHFGTSARRLLSTNNLRLFNGDFEFHPAVFDFAEQKVLLQAGLEKLDKTETRAYRKRRKQYLESPRATSESIDSLFLPDEYYDFQRVGLPCVASSLAKKTLKQDHFDGVINNYREIHVTAWPDDDSELLRLLRRIEKFHPDEATQTHLLHLGSEGEIRPHVDHLTAFGSWIIGVSLGANRVLRLEKVQADGELPFEIVLPSGSVYIQK